MFKVHLSLLSGCRAGLLLEFMQDNLAFFLTEKKKYFVTFSPFWEAFGDKFPNPRCFRAFIGFL